MSDNSHNVRQSSRRDFLKATGVVVASFSLAKGVGAQRTDGSGAPAFKRGEVSGPPDRYQVDSYLEIHPDNSATIFMGYVELGQGGPTAIRQVAAEELDLDFDQVKTAPVDSFVSLESSTIASLSSGRGSVEMRAAAAEARAVLLSLASEHLQVPVGELTVAKGVVSVRNAPQRSVTYAALLAGKAFSKKFEQFEYVGIGMQLPRKGAGHATPKSPDRYRIVGTRVPRPDIAEKVRGTYEYVQHVRLPGMLHGRIVQPRGQGANGISVPTVVAIDESSIKQIPGVRVVQRENFVGVVAAREWDAVRAARQLKVTWAPFTSALPGHDALFDHWKTVKTDAIVDTAKGDTTAAIARGAHVSAASYRGPYQSHGPMAPSCSVADVRNDRATIMSPGSGVYGTRAGVARITGLPIDKIRVLYYPSSNGFGGNTGGSATTAATILSHEVGKPVRVQYSREDEHGWDNYGPALLSDVRGAVDANGKLLALEYEAWSHTAAGGNGGNGRRSATSGAEIPAASARFLGAGGVDARLYMVHESQFDMYDIPNLRIVNQRVAGQGYLRTGALRSPMDPSTFFALEGLMDDLAHEAKLDPYEFRKRNVSNPRWLGVLKAATDAAKWTPRNAATRPATRVVSGRGLAFGTHHVEMNQGTRVTYAAAVVDIEVNKDNGVILVKHVYAVMDCGLAINPGNVESQIMGMSVHGTSLALREEVQFNQTNVTSLDWNSYPTLRFGDHPAVTPIVVQQLHEQSSGAGEEALPAVVAAIGNAFFDATGVRMRQYPLTPKRVVAALASA